MLRPRLIPVLLYKNGIIVRSQGFSFHQNTGDPVHIVERFTAWKADELIYLDIGREAAYHFQETMQVIGTTSSGKDIDATVATSFLDVVSLVSKRCAIPLAVGGKIKTLAEARDRLKRGADKVTVNSEALKRPKFLEEIATTFGNQCLVVSIDVLFHLETDTWEVYGNFGKDPTGKDPVSWAREVEKRGAGEILLQSIDRDGKGNGYDLRLIKDVSEAVSIPVIALGGVGNFQHFVEGLECGASAVAAANIFHFTEHSIQHAKRHIASKGVSMRL